MSDLRALAAKAWPGPWFGNGPNDGKASGGGHRYWVHAAPSSFVVADVFREQDARYIAACDPQTITALLDRAERAEKALLDAYGLLPVDRLRLLRDGTNDAARAALESVK
ncbi:MAG: hypothetical protein KF809_17215 [Chloroflexi bacterium]|nr:hypothetical protein [Chloroflexota bacterium]